MVCKNLSTKLSYVCQLSYVYMWNMSYVGLLLYVIIYLHKYHGLLGWTIGFWKLCIRVWLIGWAIVASELNLVECMTSGFDCTQLCWLVSWRWCCKLSPLQNCSLYPINFVVQLCNAALTPRCAPGGAVAVLGRSGGGWTDRGQRTSWFLVVHSVILRVKLRKGICICGLNSSSFCCMSSWSCLTFFFDVEFHLVISICTHCSVDGRFSASTHATSVGYNVLGLQLAVPLFF